VGIVTVLVVLGAVVIGAVVIRKRNNAGREGVGLNCPLGYSSTR
jgi:hypothetical protein